MSVQRLLRRVLLLAFAGGLFACRKPAVTETATPAPDARPDFVTSATRGSAAAPAPPPTTTPAPPPPAVMKEAAEEPPRTPAQLQSEYLAAKEFPDKVQLIYDLGDLDTPEAVATLQRLFEAESDEDLKQEMLDATERMEEQIPARLAFLAAAMRPGQPEDIRDGAVGQLLTIDDRRAIPIWQQLLKDRDPDRRELAEQRIEELQQLD